MELGEAVLARPEEIARPAQTQILLGYFKTRRSCGT